MRRAMKKDEISQLIPSPIKMVHANHARNHPARAWNARSPAKRARGNEKYNLPADFVSASPGACHVFKSIGFGLSLYIWVQMQRFEIVDKERYSFQKPRVAHFLFGT